MMPCWDATTFTKNRDRLLEGDLAQAFLGAVLSIPRVKRLLSSDHFSVDGTLIEAWASMKSLKPKEDGDGKPPPGDPPAGRNGVVDFHSVSGAPTRPMPARPIPMRGSTAKAVGGKPSSAILAMR